jgi:hypothetical protein
MFTTRSPRPRSEQVPDRITKKQRRKQLRELYAQMPTVKCKGLCSAICGGRIECSDLEREVIEARAGKALTTDRRSVCTMLSPNGHCTVYGDRPMLCRLWGAVPQLPCPHGCEVQDPISDEQGFVLMLESFRVGGGRHADLPVDSDTDIAVALSRLRSPAGQRAMGEILTRGRASDRARLLDDSA